MTAVIINAANAARHIILFGLRSNGGRVLRLELFEPVVDKRQIRRRRVRGQ
jgi:hypothetical protein